MTILLVTHFVGLSLGLGGAALGVILFIKSMADNYINQSEYRLLELTSRVTFFGLFLLYATGAGFLINGVPTTDVFWAKMAVVAVVTVTESIVLAFFLPLVKRFADHDIALDSTDFTEYVPLLVSVTSVSVLSWFTALTFGVMRGTALPFNVLLGTYVMLAIFCLITANVAAWMLAQIRLHNEAMQIQKVQTENAYAEHAMQQAAGGREVIKGVTFEEEFGELPLTPAFAEPLLAQSATPDVGFMAHTHQTSSSIKGVRFNDHHPILNI